MTRNRHKMIEKMADSLLCPLHSIQFLPLVFLPLWIEHTRKALSIPTSSFLLRVNDFEGKDANNLEIARFLVQILQTLAYSIIIRRWTVGKHMFKTVIWARDNWKPVRSPPILMMLQIRLRDSSRDDWIKEFIKRRWSSGLLGLQRKKNSQLP